MRLAPPGGVTFTGAMTWQGTIDQGRVKVWNGALAPAAARAPGLGASRRRAPVAASRRRRSVHRPELPRSRQSNAGIEPHPRRRVRLGRAGERAPSHGGRQEPRRRARDRRRGLSAAGPKPVRLVSGPTRAAAVRPARTPKENPSCASCSAASLALAIVLAVPPSAHAAPETRRVRGHQRLHERRPERHPAREPRRDAGRRDRVQRRACAGSAGACSSSIASGQDNIQIIDPAQNYATVHQFSTGNGSNPQDISFVSPTKAYVTRLGSPNLLR